MLASVVGTVAEVASIVSENSQSENKRRTSNSRPENKKSSIRDFSDNNLNTIVEKPTEKVLSTHASPEEHTVPARKRRCHTKEGTIWKDKDAYPGGGKNHEKE